MTSATYKYSLKADSGYKSDQTGKITPETHGVVCAALDGGLSDDLLLLRGAPALLAAALKVLQKLEHPTAGVTVFDQEALREAIDKVTSNSN